MLFLALLMLGPHGTAGGHHVVAQTWQMRARDGSSPRDFGRALGRHDVITVVPRGNRPLENFEVGNGGRIGVGFVGGRNIGLKFKSPF